MQYYQWGCFLYQSRVVIRVRNIVSVKVINRVEVILYMMGLQSQS